MSGEPQRSFVQVSWTAKGGAATISTAHPVSLVGSTAVAMRVFTAPGAVNAAVDVELVDVGGRQVRIGAAALRGLPKAARLGKAWAQELRVPLSATVFTAAGVDARRIAAIRLVPASAAGKIWLVDAWGWQPGLSGQSRPALARADIGRVTVIEGDNGSRTVKVPVRLTGKVGRGAKLAFYVVHPTGRVSAGVLPVKPGEPSVQVSVTVRGNTVDDPGRRRILVLIRPYREIAVAEHIGGVVVVDDDPSRAVRARV